MSHHTQQPNNLTGHPTIVITNPSPYRYGGYGNRTSCSVCYPYRHCMLVTGIIAVVGWIIFLALMITAIVNAAKGSDVEMGRNNWFESQKGHTDKYFGMATGCGFAMFVCFVLTYTLLPISIMLIKHGPTSVTTTGSAGLNPRFPVLDTNNHTQQTNMDFIKRNTAVTTIIRTHSLGSYNSDGSAADVRIYTTTSLMFDSSVDTAPPLRGDAVGGFSSDGTENATEGGGADSEGRGGAIGGAD